MERIQKINGLEKLKMESRILFSDWQAFFLRKSLTEVEIFHNQRYSISVIASTICWPVRYHTATAGSIATCLFHCSLIKK
jgi:uracil-DNA glycosylase